MNNERGETMQLSQAVQKRIIKICKENNISLNGLSEKSNLPTSTVYSIYYGKSKDPKLSTILAICEGCNMNLTDFFNDKTFKRDKLNDL